jgi:phosphate transport system ATP-binding protein
MVGVEGLAGGGPSKPPAPHLEKTRPYLAETIDQASEHSTSGQRGHSAGDTRVGVVVRERGAAAAGVKMSIESFSLAYGQFIAVKEVTMPIAERHVTAIIGPSGCGKSTLLRSINRMNDLIPNVSAQGAMRISGKNIYDPDMDVVALRRRIGMVFQRPNPFPKSIFDNAAYGLRHDRLTRKALTERVEQSLRRAALWDEVKDKLGQSALSLSGGQQQRLCIARAIALAPEILLLDEPTSALDPIATHKVEELMIELSRDYTIVVVTHNMQQAARASDSTAFMLMDESRAGRLIEFGPTREIFTNPKDRRTEDYITGRFG